MASMETTSSSVNFSNCERYANHRSYEVGVVWFCKLATLAC